MQSIWETKGQRGSNTATIKSSCRALVPKRDSKVPPPKSTYFLNISISTKKSTAFNESTPRVRIKIPNLLVKEKQHHNNGDKTSNNIHNTSRVKKKVVNHKKLVLPTKVTSLLSNVFPSSSSSKKSSVTGNSNPGRNAEECQIQRITEDIFMKTALEDSEWSESLSSTISSKSEDQPFSHLPKICDILKERLEIKEEDVNWFGFDRKDAKQTITTYKPPSKVKMGFKSFLNRNNSSFNFISRARGKSSAHSSRSSRSNVHNSRGRDIESKEKVYVKSFLKIQTAEEEEGDCNELCKKKILMGERCRPLNFACTAMIRTVKSKGYPS